MSWVTVIWSMIASACLTLGAIYWLVWFRNRSRWAHLLFAVTAISTTAFAFAELQMMRAETPADLFAALRWGQIALFVWLVSIVWFIRFYLGAGRLWLAWTFCGLRAVYLLIIFAGSRNVIYTSIPSLRHMQFLGEPVTILGGIPNPMTLFGQFAVLLLLIFIADASLTTWRRGDRRKALTVGGSATLFILTSLGTAMAVIWGDLEAPIAFSLLYLGLVAVMAYELSHDVLRASQLVQQLQASQAGLRESEARMSLAVDAAGFGIWIRDLASDDIWASARWREIFGFPPSVPLNFETVMQRVHPDDRDTLQDANARALAGEATSDDRYQAEFRIALPDGTTRWISSIRRIERNAAGRPVLIRGAGRDITARKEAEHEAQRLRQEIAHVGRVSMMGQLASALAHEITQPLAAIQVNTAAAERFIEQTPPNLDEVRAILADIRKDDERAGAVIDGMRALLMRHTVDSRRLQVSALVGDVAALVRIDAMARQVKVDVQVPSDLPDVCGDRVHLQQVLLNLVLNGMDALDEAKPNDRRVHVSARRGGPFIVEIAVSDAGPGISDEVLPQIFDPFFTTKAHGMGMGLAISRAIVEAHGGHLWAENQAGGGSVFRFTLETTREADAV